MAVLGQMKQQSHPSGHLPMDYGSESRLTEICAADRHDCVIILGKTFVKLTSESRALPSTIPNAEPAPLSAKTFRRFCTARLL